MYFYTTKTIQQFKQNLGVFFGLANDTLKCIGY